MSLDAWFKDGKDRAGRNRHPREYRIGQLREMAQRRRDEARFWQDHGNTLRATHLRQCAENDEYLAAMMRR